jgi:hypothetical protein
MAEAKREVGQDEARSNAVVNTYVVSKAGARVVERVVVLSDKAAQRLEIKGKVPSRSTNGRPPPTALPPKTHANGSASR